jgi:hypothetical protein
MLSLMFTLTMSDLSLDSIAMFISPDKRKTKKKNNLQTKIQKHIYITYI